MFSTICLLFLCGFLFWMNTSKRVAWPDKNHILATAATNPAYSRCIAGALFLLGAILCVVALGWGSGLFATVVILMASGSVSVLFFPFHYLGVKGITILYICSLALELLIH
jgi:hypothetical protein